MESVSGGNAWIDSYLEALLSTGLSSEYSRAPASESSAASSGGKAAGGALSPAASANKPGRRVADADASVYAKYYVNQILQLGEEGIKGAWARATSTRGGSERDARLEHLSWRVWHLKRKKEAAARARAAAAARAAALGAAGGGVAPSPRSLSASASARHFADTDLDDDDLLSPAAMGQATPLSGGARGGAGASLSSGRPTPRSSADARSSSSAAAAAAAPAATTATTTTQNTVAAAAAALADLRLPDRSLPRVRIAAPGEEEEEQEEGGERAAGAAAQAGMSASEAWLRGGYSGSPTGADAAVASASTAARTVRLQAPSPARQQPQQQPKDPFANRVDGLYIVLASMHGLVRGERMELGRDPDTGGQVKYVVELAKALSRHPAVHRVDLLTRLVADPRVDPEYSEPVEVLVPPRIPTQQSAGGGGGGAASPGKTSFDANAASSSSTTTNNNNNASTPTAAGGPDAAAANAAALGGAYIVRLRAGPPTRYLRKERLWPHVREFADRAISHVRSTLAALSDAGAPCELYCVHGHYADAGEAAALMAATLGVDMVITGHSLGRNKLEHLLASGTMTRAEVEASYRISRRIEAEERALESAVMVLTSTRQEVDDQWGLYHAYNQKLAAVLAARPRPGRSMPAMTVIPPGLDFSAMKGVDLLKGGRAGGGGTAGGGGGSSSYSSGAAGGAGAGEGAGGEGAGASKAFGVEALLSPRAGEGSGVVSGGEGENGNNAASGAATPRGLVSPRASDGDNTTNSQNDEGPAPPPAPHQQQQQEDPPIWGDIFSFLKNPRKPAILAMSRPDAKKNLTTLVEAFAANGTLRQLANLVLVMGNRDTLEALAPGSRAVVEAVFRLVDNHGLWGSVAFPKHHAQSDVGDIYRLPGATRGAFVNVALQEPFGLTVIEAAAHGVPCVATKHGGPVDILATLHHGLLVEPTDAKAVGDALLKILTTPSLWDQMSRNGRENVTAYSWPSHCDRYLRALEAVKARARAAAASRSRLSGTWDLESLRARDRRQRRRLGAVGGVGASQELLDRVAVAGGEGSDGELHQQQRARRRRGGGEEEGGGGVGVGSDGERDGNGSPLLPPPIALSPRGSAGELLGDPTSAGFACFGGGGVSALLPLSPQRAPSPPPDLATTPTTTARLLLPPPTAASSAAVIVSPPSSSSAEQQQQRLRSAPAIHKSSSFVAAAASADDCLLASASAADDVGDALAAAASAAASATAFAAAAAGTNDRAANSSRRNSASGGASIPGPLGYRRTRFVVVPLDGEHGAAAAAAAIVAFAAAIEAGEQARAVAFDDGDGGGDSDDLRSRLPPLPGLGVASTLGFDHSARLLAEHGAPLDALDWIVCHAGADIWHAHSHCEIAGPFDAEGDAQRSGGGSELAAATTPTNNTCPPGATHRWAADDAWEEHIGAGWDRASVARLVVKVLKPSPLASLGDKGLLGALAGGGASGGNGVCGANDDDKNSSNPHAAAAAAGAAAAEVDDASLAALLRTLDGLSPAGRTHPHHVLLDLDRETSRAVAAAARAAAAAAASTSGGAVGSSASSMPAKATTEEVALSVVDRLRRRMRANGYRAHMTLEAVPVPRASLKLDEKEEEEKEKAAAAATTSSSSFSKRPSTVSARLHITPLRASRALALRFLACRFGLTMDDFTVVGLPPAVRLVPESAAVASKRRRAAAEEGGGGGEGAGADGANELEDLDPCYDVTPRTSDLVELASGACAVRILKPEKKKKGAEDEGEDEEDEQDEDAAIFAAAASSPLLTRLEFRIDPDDFGRRVRLLRCSDSASSLTQAAGEVVSVPPPAPTPLSGPSPRASADFQFRLPRVTATATTTTAVLSSASAASGSSSSSTPAAAAAASSLKQKAAAAAAAAVKRATRLLSTLEETRDGNVWKH